METQNWRSLVRTAGILNEDIRRRLLDEVYHKIQNWRGPLPTHQDLLRICPAEQIEGFLLHVVTDEDGNEEARKRFIQFVAETGYKDEPGVAPHGEYQQVRRTTPIHLALRVKFNDWDGIVRLLFRIYDRFNLNYVDDRGMTHFHAAFCLADNRLLVKKFIAKGQDPNMMIGGYSLLRCVLCNNDTELAADLVSRGGDPTRVDGDGSTALHIICQRRHEYLVRIFQRVFGNSGRNVQINVEDRSGDTPLHLAVRHCFPLTMEILLRLGGNPSQTDREGCTALHLICMRSKPYRALIIFFKTCHEIGRRVNVNATNNDGRTPLNLLYYLNGSRHHKTVVLLQNHGARR
ncbi:unnamed protein product [Trichogramma brassicae]|uniref:Uncharacterized protein n=1 Tax=Trichogramma brassicae TaxID=86971 RepID=A0A6H5IZE5_9HYME|nr:unnamed protein product [Trichogramma brassicae]